MKLEGVEIFAVGKWNGFSFSESDVQSMAEAWNKLSKVHKVPMKLGHNQEQSMTDGFPALGWVTNVRFKNGKLLADFDHVPDIVHNAIEKKLYNSVSIELDIDVEYKGQHFDYVLSGVALLGADLPAVNTLEDLSAFIEGEEGAKFSSARKLSFTFNEEGNTMPDPTLAELQAQMVSLSSRQKVLEDELASEQKKALKFSAENTELKAKLEEDEKKRKQAVFSAKKESLVQHLDGLVKSEAITPAQREAFSAKITEDNIDQMTDTINVFGEGKKFSSKEEAKVVDKTDTPDSPDLEILQKVSELQLKNSGLAFSSARDMVFKANPKLAKEYIAMHDGGDA